MHQGQYIFRYIVCVCVCVCVCVLTFVAKECASFFFVLYVCRP